MQSVSFEDLGDPPSGITYEVCCSCTPPPVAVMLLKSLAALYMTMACRFALADPCH